MEELGRNPEPALRGLYAERPHLYHEVIILCIGNQSYLYHTAAIQDGLRFKTLALLHEHTNAFLERKKLLKKKKESANVRECREWYCASSQWVTDFNRLLLSTDASSSGLDGGDPSSSGGKGEAGSHPHLPPAQQPPQLQQQQEEFIVPADEHFIRCPISREIFESFFDEDEGEFMYRNAARLLVTESADAVLFKLGRETEEASVRYLIVHKLLVLDSWLQAGKATTLSDALMRYEAVPAAVAKEVARKLRNAAGDEENEDDVFVMLDLFK